MSESGPGARKILVWDLPVRLFHWILVALLAFSWYTAEFGPMDWHMISGQAILMLVLFRILWGLFGSASARFSTFLTGPASALGYGRDLFAGRKRPFLGHNPLGGWMVLLLLLVVALQASLGLFANDDIFSEGPLAHLVDKATSDRLTGLHGANFNLLLALAGLHVAAVFFYLLVKRDNLIRPMITGRKDWTGPEAAPKTRSPLVALVLLALSAAAVWLLVTQL